MREEKKLNIRIGQVKDVNNRQVFSNHVLCAQLLRYTVCIWDDYAKTMEKAHPGISKTKGFRYPPVFPIVYYEGTGKCMEQKRM